MNCQQPTIKVYDSFHGYAYHCYETHSMTPFPTCKSRVPNDPNVEAYSIYCVCHMIDDGTPMMQCSACAEWYHEACCDVPA